MNSANRSDISSRWLVPVYLALITIGLEYIAHGSQDMYPTFLKDQLHFSDGLASIILGTVYFSAFIGGATVGYCSTFFGRRLAMIVVLIIGAATIPAYVLPKNSAIVIGAVIEQVCVQGAFGILPIYLLELAPLESRSFMVGVVYELGNLVASFAPSIVAVLAQRFPQSSLKTIIVMDTYDYGKSIGILLSFVYVFVIPLVFFGPEKRNMDELQKMNPSNGDKDRDIESDASGALERLPLLPNSKDELK